jgi:hypothetical protein
VVRRVERLYTLRAQLSAKKGAACQHFADNFISKMLEVSKIQGITFQGGDNTHNA